LPGGARAIGPAALQGRPITFGLRLAPLMGEALLVMVVPPAGRGHERGKMMNTNRIRAGLIVLCCVPLVVGGGLCGCGEVCAVLNHLVGVPEAVPPLGELMADLASALISGFYAAPAYSDGGLDGGGYGYWFPELTPAIGASQADLAGIWVHGDGLAAVHIDESGWVYQIDRAEDFGGNTLPAGLPLIPMTLFNVGSATVQPDGSVQADLSASLLGLRASANVTGTLDSTFNVIYGVTSELTFDMGQDPETGVDFAPWFRWNPETGILVILEPMMEAGE